MGILDRFRSVELDDIAAARASYLEIAEASTRRSRESSEALEAETVLRLPPGSGFLHDLLRLDYGSTNGREACIGYVHTRPVKLRGILKDRSFGNVSLSGFDWAGARFEVTGPLQAAAALSDWARTWLKDPGPEGSSASIRELRRLVKARHTAAAEGAPEPAGAIHAVRIFDDASFAVDFGSAPLAAFTGLLESLDRAGAFEIRIGAERKRHEIFQDEVADLLGRIHAADLEARRGRDLPGEFRAWFAAAAEGLAARCRTADPDARTQVREDIEARVAEIDDRIICMLERDGEDALHLRFGSDGWIDLVSEIRGLVAGWTPPEGWRIGAFQPPRPWTDVTALAPLRFGARVEIDLRRVRATLTPRSCDVEVELEFEDFGRFTAEGLRAAAREILFEILGEETYLSAVGGVTVRMQRDDPGDSVPLSELAPAFDRCVAEVRRRLEALDAAGGRARVDMNLALLLDRLTAFQQVQKDYAAIARQHADAGEIDLALVFWIDDEAQERLLEDAFEDFQFCIEDSLSLRGAGHLLSAGACDGGLPVESFRDWLQDRLIPGLDAGALLVDIRPQLDCEAIAAADEAAKTLMNAGDYALAARILRPAVACHVEITEGRLHSKLGLCHLDTQDYPEAITVLGEALDLLDDEETCFKGESYTNMGACLDLSGQVETALPYFLKALEFDPAIATRPYNVGQACAKLGRVEEACRHLAEALDRDPSIIDMIRSDSDLAAFRDTPAFKAMLAGDA